jgi:hypothetical protein
LGIKKAQQFGKNCGGISLASSLLQDHGVILPRKLFGDKKIPAILQKTAEGFL